MRSAFSIFLLLLFVQFNIKNWGNSKLPWTWYSFPATDKRRLKNVLSYNRNFNLKPLRTCSMNQEIQIFRVYEHYTLKKRILFTYYDRSFIDPSIHDEFLTFDIKPIVHDLYHWWCLWQRIKTDHSKWWNFFFFMASTSCS